MSTTSSINKSPKRWTLKVVTKGILGHATKNTGLEGTIMITISGSPAVKKGLNGLNSITRSEIKESTAQLLEVDVQKLYALIQLIFLIICMMEPI